MLIGDSVTYRGRRYVVVGVTPTSVTPFQVELENPDTGESEWIVWPPLEEVERAALRITRDQATGKTVE
jgi:hypothetical protein